MTTLGTAQDDRSDTGRRARTNQSIARNGAARCPHEFVTETAGSSVSRLACTACGSVRLHQVVAPDLEVCWSRTDYEIVGRYYRELAG